MTGWLDDVRWNADGLVAAIAQDATSLKVLTLAWMNRDALARTNDTREAHYFSRSRNKLWRKGESSGHVQRVREIRPDCDGDAKNGCEQAIANAKAAKQPIMLAEQELPFDRYWSKN